MSEGKIMICNRKRIMIFTSQCEQGLSRISADRICDRKRSSLNCALFSGESRHGSSATSPMGVTACASHGAIRSLPCQSVSVKLEESLPSLLMTSSSLCGSAHQDCSSGPKTAQDPVRQFLQGEMLFSAAIYILLRG